MKWWQPWRPAPPAHDARLDQAGRWPGATAGINAEAMQPWMPSSAPGQPGAWYHGNIPATGHWMPISVHWLQSGRTIQARNLKQIGPYDGSTASAIALENALASTLKGLTGGN